MFRVVVVVLLWFCFLPKGDNIKGICKFYGIIDFHKCVFFAVLLCLGFWLLFVCALLFFEFVFVCCLFVLFVLSVLLCCLNFCVICCLCYYAFNCSVLLFSFCAGFVFCLKQITSNGICRFCDIIHLHRFVFFCCVSVFLLLIVICVCVLLLFCLILLLFACFLFCLCFLFFALIF